MKYAFFLLLALLAAVIVAGALNVDNGYVLLSWHHTSVEMSLGTLMVLILFSVLLAVSANHPGGEALDLPAASA